MLMELNQTMYEIQRGIATITLYRPDKMNAFTPTIRKELIGLFAEFRIGRGNVYQVTGMRTGDINASFFNGGKILLNFVILEFFGAPLVVGFIEYLDGLAGGRPAMIDGIKHATGN